MDAVLILSSVLDGFFVENVDGMPFLGVCHYFSGKRALESRPLFGGKGKV